MSNDLKLPTTGKDQQRPREALLIGSDYEQIWQQLDVFNQPLTAKLLKRLPRLTSRRRLSLNVDLGTKEKKKKKSEETKENGNIKTKKSILKASTVAEDKPRKAKKVNFDAETMKVRDRVDFFNLDEMEAFLDEQDRKEMESDDKKKTGKEDDDEEEKDEEIDYFADMPSDDEDDDEEDEEASDQLMYEDFFDPPKKGKQMDIDEDGEDGDEDDEEEEEEEDQNEDDEDFDTRDVDESDLAAMGDGQGLLGVASSDEEEDGEGALPKSTYDVVNEKLRSLATDGLGSDDENDPGKSDFERAQIRLRRKISTAERELLMPAATKWQLAGETAGALRPENSLLEEHLEFDTTAKPPPTLTEAFTRSLEDLIRQRIKDKVFDDVERKAKPSEVPFEFRRRIMLDSEKSKVGLAEVYEQEYIKQQEKAKEANGADPNAVRPGQFVSAGEVEETETRREVRRLMSNLFRKLDALSAFHYTPRPPEPEVKIISNMPAVTAEEATPLTVSDMNLLAPEEAFNTRNRKVLQAPGERDATDRKRARRLKKKKQGIKQKLGKGVVVSKKTTAKNGQEVVADKKAFTSSTKFFDRLQEVKETAKVEKVKRQKPKVDTTNLAKKLKL